MRAKHQHVCKEMNIYEQYQPEVVCKFQHRMYNRSESPPKNSNLPVYKISSLKITPSKTPNSGQFSYPLPNMFHFYLKKSTRVPI
jgi:hypothetical protein